jgi:catechol 2,3-dioxygenase-like lactoylglutathione lyase family enzyme
MGRASVLHPFCIYEAVRRSGARSCRSERRCTVTGKEESLKSQVHVITLAVDDLERALRFYRDGLGLESEGIIATEFARDERSGAGAIAMFKLEGGLILSLYPRAELAHDGKVALGAPKSGEFSLGQLVESRSAVDAALDAAEAARRHHYRPTPRSPVRDLLGLLQGPRRPSLGDHLEPVDRLTGPAR